RVCAGTSGGFLKTREGPATLATRARFGKRSKSRDPSHSRACLAGDHFDSAEFSERARITRRNRIEKIALQFQLDDRYGLTATAESPSPVRTTKLRVAVVDEVTLLRQQIIVNDIERLPGRHHGDFLPA